MVHLCLLLFLFLCVIEFLFFAYFGYSAFLSETKIMACSKFLPTEKKKKNCKNEMKNVKCFSLSSFPILNFILLETQMIFIATNCIFYRGWSLLLTLYCGIFFLSFPLVPLREVPFHEKNLLQVSRFSLKCERSLKFPIY